MIILKFCKIMNKHELKEMVVETMSSVFNLQPSKIKPDSSPKNIDNWDSLNHIKLIVALEEEINTEFEPEEISIMTSLNAILEVAERKLTKKQ